MATKAGGELTLKLLQEVRDLQQHLQASGERTNEHMSRVVRMLGQLSEDRDQLKKRLEDHERRLAALEQQ